MLGTPFGVSGLLAFSIKVLFAAFVQVQVQVQVPSRGHRCVDPSLLMIRPSRSRPGLRLGWGWQASTDMVPDITANHRVESYLCAVL